MAAATKSARKVSLSFKLSLFILSGTLLIFAAAFYYNYHFSRELLLKNARQHAESLTFSALNRIDAVIGDAEQVPNFLARHFAARLPEPELLKSYLEDFVAATPSVFGSAAACEPYAYDARVRAFAPYAYKEEGRIRLTQLESDAYNYFIKDWYLLPKVLGKAMWSEPYYDEGGGNTLMATYSAPFVRSFAGAESFAGVVTADISLTWLQEFVAGIQLYESGRAFLLSRNGVFVSAHDPKLIMRMSVFSLAEERREPRMREIGRKMIAGEQGFVALPESVLGEAYMLYYAPLASTGWSLGVLLPQDELLADLHQLSREVVVIGLGGFALLFLVIVAISLSITRPIKQLAGKTGEIARGNLDVELPASRSRDEVGDLTRSFDDMRHALKEYIENLTETTKAKERMESELKIAHTIQMNFLPKRFPLFQDVEGFSLHAMLEPAREVGGDLYDFFMLPDGRLFFMVGDVSGKGVPAALFMAVSKTLVKGIAEHEHDPARLLEKVNAELCQDNEALLFVTMFCGILDLKTGEVVYSNGGHNPPLVVPSEGSPYWLPMPSGLVLGVVEEMVYETWRMTLAPGDKIVAYTDGVTEAMNLRDELYSDGRLLQEAGRLRSLAPEAFDAELMRSVHAFAGEAEQTDDITILVLEYRGQGR